MRERERETGGVKSCLKFFKLALHWSKFPAERSGLAKCVCVCFCVCVQHCWSLSHVSRGSSWATFFWLVGCVLTYTHSSVFFAAPPSPRPVVVLPFNNTNYSAKVVLKNNSNMYHFHQFQSSKVLKHLWCFFLSTGRKHIRRNGT